MEVVFKYKDIIDRCEQLSSFESKGKVNDAGESLYLDIHINEIDRLLVRKYAEQARGILASEMEKMIDERLVSIVEFSGILDTPNIASWVNGPMIEDIVFVRIYGSKEGNESLYQFVYARKETENYYHFSTHVPSEYKPNSEYVYFDGTKYYEWNEQGTDIVESNADYDFMWNIHTATRWKENKAFRMHVTEAIVAYTMSAWLSDKLPERAKFYESLFTASLAMAKKNLYTKQEPKYE